MILKEFSRENGTLGPDGSKLLLPNSNLYYYRNSWTGENSTHKRTLETLSKKLQDTCGLPHFSLVLVELKHVQIFCVGQCSSVIQKIFIDLKNVFDIMYQRNCRVVVKQINWSHGNSWLFHNFSLLYKICASPVYWSYEKLLILFHKSLHYTKHVLHQCLPPHSWWCWFG